MRRKAVGFYWTLPVPWAGFTNLCEGDIEEACRRSRTIRYQREACRRHAHECKVEIIHEIAFLEIEPDRGTEHIEGPLKKIAPLCRAQDADVLYVDFKVLEGWRRNEALYAAAAALGLRLDPVFPERLPLDGGWFDPSGHFSDWRERQREWMAGKAARIAAAQSRATALRAAGAKNPEIARQLNEESLRSATGKPWTAENVRKLLAVPR